MVNDTIIAAPRRTRRRFLKASAALALPWIVPSTVLGAQAPGNRINVACIGTGNQGGRISGPAFNMRHRYVPAGDFAGYIDYLADAVAVAVAQVENI